MSHRKYDAVQRDSPASAVLEAAILRVLANGAPLGKSEIMRAADIQPRHDDAVAKVLYALRASGKLTQIGSRRTSAYCLATTPIAKIDATHEDVARASRQIPIVGSKVTFVFGVAEVTGTVIEDRGDLGVGGQRLLRVRFQLEAAGEPFETEIAIDRVKLAN